MRLRRILRTTRVVQKEIFICIQNTCIYGKEWKSIWVLGDTASQVKTWWSGALNNCYESNTGGHVRRDCPSWGQPRLTNNNEEFNYMVNPLSHYCKCNQPGHVRIKCPDLGQSRTSYRGGQDEGVRCYNHNKYGHCSRDCRLPNRTRKDHEPVLTEDKFRKICKKVITENVKPRENHLLHNVLFFTAESE